MCGVLAAVPVMGWRLFLQAGQIGESSGYGSEDICTKFVPVDHT
jgi:hypothetical protein